jgi:hypothetical protein
MKPGGHKGNVEHRFGGKRKVITGPTTKELPALSIQCFEQRHSECSGKCLPFEPETDCECEHHARNNQ